MNAETIIRNAIPNATDELIDYILWERTPYPCGAISPKRLYKSADRLRRAEENNIRLCDLCDNMVDSNNKFTCRKCKSMLEKYRGSQAN